MKNIDEHYKDWCGESHIVNSCHPVHDSAAAQDFAEYYNKEVMSENKQVDYRQLLKEVLHFQQEIISSPLRFNGVHIDTIKEVFARYGIEYTQSF